jgi:rifampin ADP-ribosylating transferase
MLTHKTEDLITYYHGTKANLALGDLIEPGFNSNYGQRKGAKYVYLTATLDAATWGAELAVGEGVSRIYIEETLGSFEDGRVPGGSKRVL